MKKIVIGTVAALALAFTGCNYSRTPTGGNAGTETVRGTGGSGINASAPSGAYGNGHNTQNQSALGQGTMQQTPAQQRQHQQRLNAQQSGSSGGGSNR